MLPSGRRDIGVRHGLSCGNPADLSFPLWLGTAGRWGRDPRRCRATGHALAGADEEGPRASFLGDLRDRSHRVSTVQTRYAKSGDVHIAYQVVGNGPGDLVFVQGWVTNVELWWEEPPWSAFFQRLASFSRLILFDKARYRSVRPGVGPRDANAGRSHGRRASGHGCRRVDHRIHSRPLRSDSTFDRLIAASPKLRSGIVAA